jgi:hypothetical protein
VDLALSRSGEIKMSIELAPKSCHVFQNLMFVLYRLDLNGVDGAVVSCWFRSCSKCPIDDYRGVKL